EENVFHTTGIKRSQRTALVRLEAPINGRTTSISVAHMNRAVLPRYPLERPHCHINLNQLALTSKGASFLAAAQEEIVARVRDLLKPGLEQEKVEHVSIFGLAPIPLLVLLGFHLGTTIPADVFQHHHDSEDWTWKTDRTRREF